MALKDDVELYEFKKVQLQKSFAKYFYDRVKEIGYDVKLAKVYETPNNMAAYGE